MSKTAAGRLIAALLVAASLAALPALAADAVFPPGSKLGLVPPDTMITSRSFVGFEDRSNKAAVLLVALPAAAYPQIEKSVTPEELKKQGITQLSREPFSVGVGKAFLIVGEQEIDNVKVRKWLVVAETPDVTAMITAQIPDPARDIYPDDKVRATLASLALRTTVPDEEQLSLLPFKVETLAEFKIGSVVPGRAVLLSDAEKAGPATLAQPRIVIFAVPIAPPQNEDRDTFARRVLATVSGLKEMRITTSEPLRIGGQQGHQIIANGKDAATDADLTVVQWIRFGGSGFLHLVGISPKDSWKEAYTRFRAVRDGIDLR